MPEYAVISVGQLNPYGHPTEDVLSRLKDADAQVYRTDLQGTIVCESDGHSLSFTTEKQVPDPAALYAPSAAPMLFASLTTPKMGSDDYLYVLNTNSHKFHLPSCSSVAKMQDKHRSYSSSSPEELVAQGYDPCGQCTPYTVPSTPAPTHDPSKAGTDYVLNKNSKKFHYLDCKSVKKMKESNKEYYTGTRDDLIKRGYDPCGNCNP